MTFRHDGSLCVIESCGRRAERGAEQLCAGHRTRLRVHGDVLADVPIRRGTSDEERLMAKVAKDTETGCWLWQAQTDKNGYGRTSLKACPVPAHRAMWAVLRGPIPAGMQVDHLCRVPACVNPEHLELVTPKENSARRVRKPRPPRTECKKGHPLNEHGRCLTCNRESYRRRRASLPC